MQGEAVGLVIDDNAPDHIQDRDVSFVYAPDVAAAVLDVVRCGAQAHGEAYHISCNERVLFSQFAKMIAARLGLENSLRFDFKESCPMISVTMGAIDNDKARKELGFAPTALEDVVKLTTAWNLSVDNQVYTMKMQEDTTTSSGSDSSSSDSDSDTGREKTAAAGFMSEDSSDEEEEAAEKIQSTREPFRFGFGAED